MSSASFTGVAHSAAARVQVRFGDAFAADLPKTIVKVDTTTMTVDQVVAHILAL